MKNTYVVNHDFGYNGSLDDIEIKKLELRNIIDVKAYIEECIKIIFNAEYENNILTFNDNTKVKIFID